MSLLIDCRIEQHTFIAAPPVEVYDTITSADGWDAFFTTGFEIDPRPGGTVYFRWKDWGPDFYNLEAEGKVLQTDRPNLFAFQWYPVGRDDPTTVRFELASKFGGTVVHLTERGYPDTPAGRRMFCECAAGWAEAVTLLKFYLEYGVIYTQPKKE